MLVGLDDTDGPSGGCTTWVLTELLRNVRDGPPGLDLLGLPRLVRLNPNIPWKTRGNAALAARFGRGRGAPRVVGEVDGRPLRCFPRGEKLRTEAVHRLWEAALAALTEGARWGDAGTDPTVVMTERAPPPSWYWDAVRGVVAPGKVRAALLELPGEVRWAAFGSGQGLVGAAAAIAWPGRRRTFEGIAYREPERWGTPRRVDPESVRAMARRHPSTFLSWDERTRRTLVTPHTPCPILYGIRGHRWQEIPRALGELRGEAVERWALFQTNQATGDHLLPRRGNDMAAATSGWYEGRVAARPETLRGGHVRLVVEDASGSVECLAFEPTKTLPGVVRELLPGDEVRVWGSVPWESTPPALRLEGIEVLRTHARPSRDRPLRCVGCGRAMSSLGRGKGYRCRTCRARAPPETSTPSQNSREHLQGVHLPTPSARRHLSPLGAPGTPGHGPRGNR